MELVLQNAFVRSVFERGDVEQLRTLAEVLLWSEHGTVAHCATARTLPMAAEVLRSMAVEQLVGETMLGDCTKSPMNEGRSHLTRALL